jgi:hypothetical protein
MGQQADNRSEIRDAEIKIFFMAEAFSGMPPRIVFGLSGAAG